VRLTGDMLNVTREEDLPPQVRDLLGSFLQGLQARAVLKRSGIPVSYLSCNSYFMDDFIRVFGVSLIFKRMLVVPFDRRTSFLDTTDLGEAATTLLLEGPPTIRTDVPRDRLRSEVLRFSEVAAIMSEGAG
jgi:hypothetical protein